MWMAGVEANAWLVDTNKRGSPIFIRENKFSAKLVCKYFAMAIRVIGIQTRRRKVRLTSGHFVRTLRRNLTILKLSTLKTAKARLGGNI